jgi:uncharacterized protein YdaU (DUF1376 family)
MNIPTWEQSTNHLLPEELGVYLKLIHRYYDTEKPIPLELRPVLRKLQLLAFEATVADILREYFVKTAKGFIHKKCAAEIKYYHQQARKNKANGAKGGRPAKTKVESITQNKPTGLTMGSVSVSQKNPNHEPLTTNRKPNISFDIFWKAYPKKANKKKAETAWNNLTNEKRASALKDCQIRFADKEKQFIPLPTTYIHGERWNDEPEQKSNGKLKLPRDDEQLLTFAKSNSLPGAMPGESFWQYRNRLNAEIEKRANK